MKYAIFRWVTRWLFLKKVALKRKNIFQKKEVSFETDFRRRVLFFTKMLRQQFSGQFTLTFEERKVIIARNGTVMVEIIIFPKACLRTVRYLVVKTNITPLPHWWVRIAFRGMKYNVTRFPVMQQLTYEKPHGP